MLQLVAPKTGSLSIDLCWDCGTNTVKCSLLMSFLVFCQNNESQQAVHDNTRSHKFESTPQAVVIQPKRTITHES